MPELPEVEVVRRGLQDHVLGRTLRSLELRGPRVARRHLPGPGDLIARVTDRTVTAVCRCGKYLWLVLSSPADDDIALLLHLGMSGQLLVQPPDAPQEKHLHAIFRFADGGSEVRFVDQRTFGGLALAEPGGDGIPSTIGHIAPDPFDPAFDETAAVANITRRTSAIKRVLLDQRVVSGIGNIYADEALWRARIHGARPADTLTKPAIRRVLGHARDVMAEALTQGGTSFDDLYVHVNGASGYFDRSLAAYGQTGRPCGRCGTPIVRDHFMNRSSFFCPRCQLAPRHRARP